MNFEEKAIQHLKDACLNSCDHLYWRPQDVIECFAESLKEAYEAGRSEAKARIEELELALSFYKARTALAKRGKENNDL